MIEDIRRHFRPYLVLQRSAPVSDPPARRVHKAGSHVVITAGRLEVICCNYGLNYLAIRAQRHRSWAYRDTSEAREIAIAVIDESLEKHSMRARARPQLFKSAAT